MRVNDKIHDDRAHRQDPEKHQLELIMLGPDPEAGDLTLRRPRSRNRSVEGSRFEDCEFEEPNTHVRRLAEGQKFPGS